ncbi:MAG: 50S ribosomal protein L11 methyltransferase, partial [Desulfofustis sp.]|nr:50S ribosomal protein L11 methyltransferase [Desulfofustis sp.]
MHHLLPDTLLSIYCLRGQVPDGHCFPPGFLGNWQEEDHSFLFFLEPQPDFIASLLREVGDAELVDHYRLTYQQWQGGSLAPLKIGRFLISPPWITASAGPGEYGLILDPGVVFGNGTHPTTCACLTAIEIACAAGSVRRLLDCGTGTGLLALAAVKLGCHQVVAVDYNLLAARTAWRNVLLNGFQDRMVVVNGRAETFCALPFDLLVANIGYPVVRDVISADAFLRQKWFVLSGLQTGE